MEKLFHYVWKHRLFPLAVLKTTDGRPVEVIDVGLHNHDSGPDFFNAKVRIGGQLWVGNVELHVKSSDWARHGHTSDPAYDNVVLHVVTQADCDVRNSRGERLPQMELPVPAQLRSNYEHLLTEDKYPRCHKCIPSLPKLAVHSWLSALQAERLERKTEDIRRRVELSDGSWEAACFQTLARNFGFGVNSDAFETWAKSLPLHSIDHHRDDIFQIEALFFGQAGLLNPTAYPERKRQRVEADEYFQRLASEYKYLSHKFSLRPIDGRAWRFLRLRPQNFPTVRLSQLANLHFRRKAGLSQLAECASAKELAKALQTEATPYWQTHFVFGAETPRSAKRLGASSVNTILINTIIPLLFAYGRHKGSEKLADKALGLMKELRAEDNNIVRLWRECGLTVDNASDTQALIQLKKEYCDRKDCLRCRFGYYHLKNEKV